MCAIFVPAIPLFPAAWFAGHPSRCRTCTPVAHPGKPCPLPIRPAGNAARPAGPAWPFDPFALLHPGSAAGRRSLFALVACCRSCRSAGPAPAAVVDPATLARWPAAGVAAQDHRPAVPLARWLHAAGAAAALALLLLPSSIRLRWPAAPLAMAAAMVRRGRRAAALATITPRSTPHITPPQHHAGGPPAPGSNTVGVATWGARVA